MTEIEKSQREFMDSVDFPIQFADEKPDDDGWSEAEIALAAFVGVFMFIIVFTVATSAVFFSG